MTDWLTSNRDLLLIISVAFVLRISTVGLLHQHGYTSDEREYISLASKLAEGKPFLDSNNEWSTKAPLFPFVLSLVFRVFGTGLLVPHFLNCILGTLIVFLSYKYVLDLTGERFTALITAALCALYPSLMIYSDILQTEVLYIVFVLLVFLFLLRMQTHDSASEAAMLGIVAALATLTRAAFFGFFPLLLAVGGWMNRTLIPRLMFGFAVWCVMLTPWTVRNFEIHDAFVPISTWGGTSLLLGNNPYSTGTWSSKPGFGEWFELQAKDDGINVADLSEVERSSFGRQLALEFIRSEPMAAAALTAKKMYMFWIYPITNSDSDEKLQAVAVLGDVIVYVLAGLGFLAARPKRAFAPMFAAIGFFGLMHVIMHCEARYRLPVMPFIVVLAAPAIALLANTRKAKEFFDIRRRKIQAALWIGGVVGIYAFTALLFLSGKI